MNRETKEHYRAYKAGKKWIYALIFAGALVAGGTAASGQQVHAAGTQASTAQATNTSAQATTTQLQATSRQTTTTAQAKVKPPTHDPNQQVDGRTVVTTKDSQGNYSVNPTQTGDPKVTVTQDNMPDYFSATNLAGDKLPVDGNQVQLTTGKESEVNSQGQTDYAQGTGILHESQQVNFESDFSLNTTVNAKWDPSMAYILGGDGMALFFENVQPDQANKNIQTGSGFGISRDASKVISFNVSTNPGQQSPLSYTDAQGNQHTNYPANQWVLYESNGNTTQAIDQPLETGVAVTQNAAGDVSYTFDLNYTAADRTILTKVYDGNGNLVQTWQYVVPTDWVGDGFTLAVTGNTAASHAAYHAQINSFNYSAATTTLNISASGLPAGSLAPDQQNIKGLVGDVVAFYPMGETAPTETPDGTKVTAAYAAPGFGYYQLRAPQFITLSNNAADNNINLLYGAQSSIKVEYIDNNSGARLKPDTTLTGWAGDNYSVTAPAIAGYDFGDVAPWSPALTGQFGTTDQTITLVYNKHVVAPKTSQLTVNYVDRNGVPIKPSTTKTYDVGDQYTVTPATISGYTYASSSAPLTGKATADNQTITLVYDKNRAPIYGMTVGVTAGIYWAPVCPLLPCLRVPIGFIGVGVDYWQI